MKKNLFVAIILLLSANVQATEVESLIGYDRKWRFGIGIERWFGFTQYEIGGSADFHDGTGYEYRFPISRLKFYLDAWVMNVGISYNPSDWGLKINYKTNFKSSVGKMEDSDWGYFYISSGGNPSFSEDTFDIYSDSESELELHVIDLNMYSNLYNSRYFSFLLGGGLLFQYFQYDCRGTVEHSPSYPFYFAIPSPVTYISYDTLTYDLFHLAPYILLHFMLHFSGFEISMITQIAPLCYLRDEDDHLLRDKESTSNSLAHSVSGEWILSYSFFNITAGFSSRVMYMISNGEQVQRNADSKATIEHKTKYWQYAFGFQVSYSL